VISVCLEHPVGPGSPCMEACVWAQREVPSICIQHSNTQCPLCSQHSARERTVSGSVSGDGDSGVGGWGIASANMITNVPISTRSFAGD
jgi:hypothetical protein